MRLFNAARRRPRPLTEESHGDGYNEMVARYEEMNVRGVGSESMGDEQRLLQNLAAPSKEKSESETGPDGKPTRQKEGCVVS